MRYIDGELPFLPSAGIPDPDTLFRPELSAAIRCGDVRTAMRLYCAGDIYLCNSRRCAKWAAAHAAAAQLAVARTSECIAHGRVTDELCMQYQRCQDPKLVEQINARRAECLRLFGVYKAEEEAWRRAHACKRFYRLFRHWFRKGSCPTKEKAS